jgi:MFS family permease
MIIGSLGSMLAWDWPAPVFFRILAGIGGGMIPQLSQAIFYQIFPPSQRGMAVHQMLRWSGEVAAQIPTQTMALVQDRLVAEASTAAWQDYFVFNAFLALLCLFPALPFWGREKYRAPVPSEPVATPAPRAVTSNGAPMSQVSSRHNPTRMS